MTVEPSPNIAPRSSLRNEVFNATASWLRKNGEKKPIFTAVRRYARWAAKRISDSKGLPVPVAELEAIARVVAGSICSRFDPNKARPAAKTPRSVRTARDVEIIKSYFASLDGSPTSVRKLAKEIGSSPAAVSRVLTAAGLSPRRNQMVQSLPEPSRRLAELIEVVLPRDGLRLVDKYELLEALETDAQTFHDSCFTLGQAGLGLQVHKTSLRALSGSEWVVLARGRRRTSGELDAWATQKEYARKSQRNSQRFNQRFYLFNLSMPLLRRRELRDIASVLLVADKTWNLVVWRDYLEASVSSRLGIGQYMSDPRALLNAVNCLFKLQDADPYDHIESPAHWLAREEDSASARRLLRLVGELHELGDGPGELVHHWSRATAYRERIEQGILPGRSLVTVDSVLSDLAEYPNEDPFDVLSWADIGAPAFLMAQPEESDGNELTLPLVGWLSEPHPDEKDLGGEWEEEFVFGPGDGS